MSSAHAMHRLLQVLETEERQAKIALEAALNNFRLLEQAKLAAVERGRTGRKGIAASAQSGNLTDRWAALEEIEAANRHIAALTPRIESAELAANVRRQQYLAKRAERRQAETLIEEAEAQQALEAGRRAQQAQDEWYLNRLHGAERAAARNEALHPASESDDART